MSCCKGGLFGKFAIALGLVAVGVLGSMVVNSPVQGQGGENGGLPDLRKGLLATDGCLGVEMAQTMSGKNVIFAWFEDRKACLRWYYSDMHEAAMDQFFPDRDSEAKHAPMSGVPEDFKGPILAVASLTMASEAKLEGVTLPISQISIELYAPLTGGLSIGGRFAPDTMKIPETKTATKGY